MVTVERDSNAVVLATAVVVVLELRRWVEVEVVQWQGGEEREREKRWS